MIRARECARQLEELLLAVIYAVISGAQGLTQAGDVLRQVFDIGHAQGFRHAGHVACIVGASARLEGFQLFDDVFVLLAGDAWNLVLAGEAAEVAHRAQGFIRLGLAQHDFGVVALKGGRPGRLRRIEVGDIDHVLAA